LSGVGLICAGNSLMRVPRIQRRWPMRCMRGRSLSAKVAIHLSSLGQGSYFITKRGGASRDAKARPEAGCRWRLAVAP